MDLGFSSDQLAEEGRGFSFLRDEPLDMRLSRTGFTAAQILNSWDESAIELILQGFGEERWAKRIAERIVERRMVKPFATTFELVEVVRSAKPKSFRDKIHPATQTFQALRIAVNGELEALELGLTKAWSALRTDGRLAVITFHSLEDRIVKNFFRDKAKEEEGRLINKKPIVASEEEIAENPRSRSAKLRIIEKNEI
jgi:16S rRNA (cytosine1402-N4)-methyltransferase